MHDCSEQGHREQECHEDRQSNDESKCLKENKVSEIEEESAHESSDAATQNTNSHLSVSLSHFECPCWLRRVHVISTQMEHIID